MHVLSSTHASYLGYGCSLRVSVLLSEQIFDSVFKGEAQKHFEGRYNWHDEMISRRFV